MPSRQSIVQSFNCALEGFIYVMKTQRNMRIHFMVAAGIITLGIYFNFTGIELLALIGAITLVLISEMFNTSIELLTDLVSSGQNPLARIIKDVSAGAVFVASLNVVIVAYLLFSRKLTFTLEQGLINVKQSPWHITFICLIVVITIVVMVKAIFHKGTPLRGGMPSGHSAIAFSMWTVIAVLTNNGLVTVLAFLLAFFLARSRLDRKIHTLWEIIAGAAVGIMVTLLAFQFLLK